MGVKCMRPAILLVAIGLCGCITTADDEMRVRPGWGPTRAKPSPTWPNSIAKGSFDIELPDWLPPVLVVAVKRLHDEATVRDDTAKAIDRLRRLACDDRMKHVWRQLYKKKRESHRPTDTYLHPATFFGVVAHRGIGCRPLTCVKKVGPIMNTKPNFLKMRPLFLSSRCRRSLILCRGPSKT
jgi:hypothetical protein